MTEFLETVWPELSFRYLELEEHAYEEWLNVPIDQTDLAAPTVQSFNGVIIVPILSAFFEVQCIGEHGSRAEEALTISTKLLMGESLRHGTHGQTSVALLPQGPRTREVYNSPPDPMRRVFSSTKGISTDDAVYELGGQVIVDESSDDNSDSGNLSHNISIKEKNSRDADHEARNEVLSRYSARAQFHPRADATRSARLARSDDRTSRTYSHSTLRRISQSHQNIIDFENQRSQTQDDKDAMRNPLCYVPRELIAEFLEFIDEFEFPKKGNDFTCDSKYESRQVALPKGLSPLEIIRKWPNHLVGDALVYIIDVSPDQNRWGTSKIVKKLPGDFIEAWNNKPKKGQAAKKPSGERVGMSNVFTHSLKSARKSVLDRMRKAGFLDDLDFELDSEGRKIGPKSKPIRGGNNACSKRRSLPGPIRSERSHPRRRLTSLSGLEAPHEGIRLRHSLRSSLPQTSFDHSVSGGKRATAPHGDAVNRKRHDDSETGPVGLGQSVHKPRQITTQGHAISSKPRADESSQNLKTAFTSAMNDYQLGEAINHSFGAINDSDISVNREGFDAAYPNANAKSHNKSAKDQDHSSLPAREPLAASRAPSSVGLFSRSGMHDAPGRRDGFNGARSWVPNSAWNPPSS